MSCPHNPRPEPVKPRLTSRAGFTTFLSLEVSAGYPVGAAGAALSRLDGGVSHAVLYVFPVQ